MGKHLQEVHYPPIILNSGEYATLQGAETISSSHNFDTAGKLVAMPLYLPATSYDRIGVNITVGAVSTWRFGIYPNDPTTNKPDGQTLIIDAGTISTNSTGFVAATISQTITTAGVYWLALLLDSYTAKPTTTCWQGNTGQCPNLPFIGGWGSASPGGRGGFGRFKLSVTTGSMPATFPTSSSKTDSMPQILLRKT